MGEAWTGAQAPIPCSTPLPRPSPAGFTRHSAEPGYPLCRGRPLSDVELTELGVVRARLVESHLGHDLLEVERVTREERHPPLPGVEPDRAADDLHDPAGIAASGGPVRDHHSAALFDRQR